MKNNALRSSINKKYKLFAVIVMILAVLIVGLLNYILGIIDEKIGLSADFTAFRLYSISSRTESVLDTIEKDIYIYTTNTAGLNDKNIDELLKSYGNKSDKLHIKNIDIVANPAIIEYYNANNEFDIVAGNVIISNSDNPLSTTQTFRVLDSYDFYTIDSETNEYDNFSAEEAITNAISYVHSPNDQRVYILQNHNSDLSVNYEIRTLLEEYNYDVNNLSLLSNETELVSEDIVVIIAPDSDLTSNELNQLEEFHDNGGSLLIALSANTMNSINMPNLSSLYEQYNIYYKNGVVIETNSKNTAVSTSNDYSDVFIIPEFAEHEITNRFILNDYKILLGVHAGALEIPDKVNDTDLTIEPIVQTSKTSYLELWDNDMDLEPDDGDEFGPLTQAVSITKTNNNDTLDSKMLVVSSPDMLLNARTYSQNVYKNYEFFHRMIRWLSVDSEDIYIASKPLADSPLMIESMNIAYFIIALVCVVIPLIIFAAGIIIYRKRKNL